MFSASRRLDSVLRCQTESTWWSLVAVRQDSRSAASSPRRVLRTSCSKRARWVRPGGAGGTASAWSRRTGPCSCPAIRTISAIPMASCPATESSPTWSATRPAASRRCRKVSGSPRSSPAATGASSWRRRPGRSRPRQWCSAPAPTSGPTDRQERPPSPRTCSRSTSRVTATLRTCLAVRCWWLGAASPVARSPRSSTGPAVTSSWPAAGLRGCPGGSATATSFGGFSRPAISTRPLARCQGRALGWPPTRRQRGTAGAATCTTGRCGAWASPCSAISWAPTVVAPDSRRTSTKALLGAMSGTRGSWTSCESWSAERGLPAPEIPEPEPFNADAPEELNLSGFGAVVFAGGFRPDYASWVRVPGAFDEFGFPLHHEGASTAVRGPLLRRRPLPPQAQVIALDRCGRGRRHRRRPDRRARVNIPTGHGG